MKMQTKTRKSKRSGRCEPKKMVTPYFRKKMKTRIQPYNKPKGRRVVHRKRLVKKCNDKE